MKNAVKVFKEIGVSVWCSELAAVKCHFNNEHNLDISRNLFSVSLKSVNVSVAMFCEHFGFLQAEGCNREHKLQNRALLAPGKACLDGWVTRHFYSQQMKFLCSTLCPC